MRTTLHRFGILTVALTIFGTGVDGCDLADFELSGYIGYIVSALGADENRAIAETLLPDVDQFMSAIVG